MKLIRSTSRRRVTTSRGQRWKAVGHWRGVAVTTWLVACLPCMAAADELAGTPISGMQVESVRTDTSGFEIKTTGTLITLELQPDRSLLHLVRRIDPKTNKIAPAKMGSVEFVFPLSGQVERTSADRREVVITVGTVRFTVRSDGVVLITPIGDSTLEYVLRSAIGDAKWNIVEGSELYQTSGYGYLIHARNPSFPGRVAAVRVDDGISMNIGIRGGTLVAVGPAKPFDFERLYGANAKPHVCFLYSNYDLALAEVRFDKLKEDGFGVFVLFGGLYESDGRGKSDPCQMYDGVCGYRYANALGVAEFIGKAKKRGFKCIAYAHGPSFARMQDPHITLNWLLDFVSRNHLDGLYMDNAKFSRNWLENYEMVRNLRDKLGEDAILYHHDSVDIWGLWSGRVFVPIDAYCDYTLKGETGDMAVVVDGDNPYLRFYSGGYGLSQAMGCHKPSKKSTISRRKLCEVGAKLHYSMRTSLPGQEAWRVNYRPLWLKNCERYRDGKLVPDVKWP